MVYHLSSQPTAELARQRRFTLDIKKLSTWGYLVPLLLLSFWLGARALNEQAIWYDEYWSLYYAGGAGNDPYSPVEV